MNLNQNLTLDQLQTGDFVALFSNDDLISTTEILFEKDERGKLHYPKNAPIPVHIASIVRYERDTVLKQGQTKETLNSGIYVFEALPESGFSINPITKYWALNTVLIFKPVDPYTDKQKKVYQKKLNNFLDSPNPMDFSTLFWNLFIYFWVLILVNGYLLINQG